MSPDVKSSDPIEISYYAQEIIAGFAESSPRLHSAESICDAQIEISSCINHLTDLYDLDPSLTDADCLISTLTAMQTRMNRLYKSVADAECEFNLMLATFYSVYVKGCIDDADRTCLIGDANDPAGQ